MHAGVVLFIGFNCWCFHMNFYVMLEELPISFNTYQILFQIFLKTNWTIYWKIVISLWTRSLAVDKKNMKYIVWLEIKENIPFPCWVSAAWETCQVSHCLYLSFRWLKPTAQCINVHRFGRNMEDTSEYPAVCANIEHYMQIWSDMCNCGAICADMRHYIKYGSSNKEYYLYKFWRSSEAENIMW